MDPLLPDFHFELPEAQIARFPPPERDGGRLMRLGPGEPEHLRILDLPGLLAPGDLLVVNDTRVVPARLRAQRASGGHVEALLLGVGPGPVEAMLKPARRLKAGERLGVQGGGHIELLERLPEGTWQVRTEPAPLELMERAGEMPLPPYLGRPAEASDRQRYQTVYAREPGAVAAPTAGLHLSPSLLEALEARGVGRAAVTLHVGIGTFRPLREEDLERGRLHEERYVVPAETARAVAETRARGGRVVAVGTTACRALEAASDAEGVLRPGSAVTDLFIREGYRFRCVDGLLTNFHLPGSSLLMLVAALAGRQRVLSAYAEAIRLGYRFYSYGDAMLLL
ncbi:MAG: tRNA preQ1(34) S-adenosylmethionine ribosyltransferase-isomerase QueA [Alphaproteobacteria bacterium]|nr:tRNA preQ1(34) S-adenosylmethionine ribosyltransferase-isomerase QueA [Alphaproteobacteria bacterium]